MKFRIILLLPIIIFGCINSGNAQTNEIDHFRDADGNTYHQLFVDFHISDILEMNYILDGSVVDGELSTDGYSVIIKNYNGLSAVKLLIKDDSGQEKEVIKSRCYIDPVLLEL